MKKIIVFSLLCICICAQAKNYNERYCSNIKKSFNAICQTVENKIILTEKIYNSLCIPYLSAILNFDNVSFIKFNKKYDSSIKPIFNDFDWKITKDDLTKCI